jgi:1,4-alpha-glucan branching enzyme
MRVHGSSGVWEIFIPYLQADTLYKFEIRQRHTGNILVKTDPYGFCFETRPGSAAKVSSLHGKIKHGLSSALKNNGCTQHLIATKCI